ncbi:MAG TPA: hypothetical protein VFY54_02045, partial [Rubrobacter sp.]|nr:hypothetical protein [Rubrobacter sp.]
MTKEIAQTVGGKKIAWLLAILAAFAVFATLGSRWSADADVVDPATAYLFLDEASSPIGVADNVDD